MIIMFKKRMLVSCLTVLFDSPYFDDSLKRQNVNIPSSSSGY